jgi:hypothetical protein
MYDKTGQATGNFTITTNNSYTNIFGKVQLMQTTTTSGYSTADGSHLQSITKVTNYQRNSLGVCYNMTQTATGRFLDRDKNGGWYNVSVLSDYVAVFTRSGWGAGVTLKSETYKIVPTSERVSIPPLNPIIG